MNLGGRGQGMAPKIRKKNEATTDEAARAIHQAGIVREDTMGLDTLRKGKKRNEKGFACRQSSVGHREAASTGDKNKRQRR